MENKTKNLLCIPFALCLIGCTHAMVTEDVSSQAVIYNSSGEEVQLCQALPLGPDIPLDPNQSFTLVTEKLGRFFIHKIASRPKSGDTRQPEIVASWVQSPPYFASRDLDGLVAAFAQSHEDELNKFKERLNYPTDLTSIQDRNELNTVINATTSWESLKGGGLSLDKAVLFAMHPNVFHRLEWMLKPEDYPDLLMDMAMVLRWDGFLKSEQVRELFMRLANVREFDLLREIVGRIPRMERMRMYESGILTYLATFDHAKLIADMIADGTIPTPRLDVIPESVTLGALAVHGQAEFVVKLLKKKILSGGVGVRLDSSILVTLIEKKYVNDVLELIQSAKIHEMLNAEQVFEALISHGHAADIIKLLQNGKIPMKEFMAQWYSGYILAVLVDKGYGSEVEALRNAYYYEGEQINPLNMMD